MKKTAYSLVVVAILVTAALLELGALNAPAKQYVCLPCGRTCDLKTHAAPGICPECNMKLVDAESIGFKNIDFEQLCKRIVANKEIVLLDVRSKEEFNDTNQTISSFGRFKDAINVNIVELNDRVSELNKYKDKEVIVYCSHSHRSPQASYFLATHGFKNVTNLEGGVSVLDPANSPDCLKSTFVFFPPK